ncbi:hypothetical protein ZWY2020_010402 [Hordeum vulgare]|nr:hypothetical protein ZWY2020_010402 [Hordeum vulgare]
MAQPPDVDEAQHALVEPSTATTSRGGSILDPWVTVVDRALRPRLRYRDGLGSLCRPSYSFVVSEIPHVNAVHLTGTCNSVFPSRRYIACKGSWRCVVPLSSTTSSTTRAPRSSKNLCDVVLEGKLRSALQRRLDLRIRRASSVGVLEKEQT